MLEVPVRIAKADIESLGAMKGLVCADPFAVSEEEVYEGGTTVFLGFAGRCLFDKRTRKADGSEYVGVFRFSAEKSQVSKAVGRCNPFTCVIDKINQGD